MSIIQDLYNIYDKEQAKHRAHRWLTNRLLTDSPVKTLQRMRDIVTTDRYKGDEFAFMQAADSEPANTQTATPVE